MEYAAPVALAISDENTQECQEVYVTLQKYGNLSVMDPPLVAATRVIESHESLPQDSSLVVHAMAVAVTSHDEEVEPTVASSLSSSATPSGDHPYYISLHASSHVDAVRVQIDEETCDQEHTGTASDSETAAADKNYPRTFCSRNAKVILIIVFFIFVGGAIGIAIPLLIRDTSNMEKGQSNQISDYSPAPSWATTMTPSVTFVPTNFPSCTADWTLTSVDTTISEKEFENFRASPDGMVAVMTFSHQSFGGTEAFFLKTLDFLGTEVLVSTMRQANLVIRDAVMTLDGSILVVGVSDDLYQAQELGGALWVFQRVQKQVWTPIHYHFTGGGSQGSVFSVATSTDGTIHAIVAGSYDDKIPPHVQVYKALNDTDGDGLLPMGDRLVESEFNNLTLVGLSGDGMRLFIYSDDGMIRIHNYLNGTWHTSQDYLLVSSASALRTLKVAENGNSLALLSLDSRSDSYLFHWNRSNWVTSVVPGQQNLNITLQHAAFSLDGRTLVFAVGGYAAGLQQLLVYEQGFETWITAHTLELPPDFTSFLGVSVDTGGDRIVVAGKELLHVYDRVCRDIAAPAAAELKDTTSPAAAGHRETVAPSPIWLQNTGAPFAPASGSEVKPSSPVAMSSDDTWFTISPTADASVMPESISTVCGFDVQILHNLSQNATILSNETQDDASMDNSTDFFSFLKGKLISDDGSIMLSITSDSLSVVIETYGLMNASALPTGIRVQYPITSFALSGQGERLLLGSADFSPQKKGGYVFVYRREGLGWELETERQIFAGKSGGVIDVSLDYDGDNIAFVAAGVNETSFVSVYLLTGGSLKLVGDSVSESWMDDSTIVRLVEQRLFIASSDGFIRAYDLVDNSWTRVGQRIPHFSEAVFIPSKNNTIVAIASKHFGVLVYDLIWTFWIPTIPNELDPLIISESSSAVDFSFSSDGKEILFTETFRTRESYPNLIPTYTSRLLGRSFDSYYGLQHQIDMTQNVTDGATTISIEMAQLTTSGNIIVATNTQVLEYTRIESCELLI